MIGRLRGVLVEKELPQVLIEVGGVGYEVWVPATTFDQLPEVGVIATLYTHFSVREDAHTLFGFFQARDRVLFRSLIKINGIGPKLALAILSHSDADAFFQCIQNREIDALTRLPGVGKKTAERIIVEMQGSLAEWKPRVMPQGLSMSTKQEVFTALLALGYKAHEANRVLGSLDFSQGTRESLLRLALQGLAS